MMHLRFSLSALSVLLFSFSVHSAVLIGFEGAEGTAISDGSPYTESGFTFSAGSGDDDPSVLDETLDTERLESSDFLTFSGSFGGAVRPLTLSSDHTATFSLLSMQVGLFASGFGNADSALTITGNQSGGGSVTQVVNSQLDPDETFVENITFDASWADLDSVEFSIAGSGFFYGLDVDNIAVAAVPELSSIFFMGIAFMGLLGRFWVR